MNESQATFLAYLERAGLRVTRERLEILDALRAAGGHFDADSLTLRLRRKGSSVSRGTVYRTIHLLVGAKVLRPVAFTERHAHYENILPNQHHDHLICLKCGRIIEFYREAIEAEMKRVCRKHDFRPSAHKMEVTGICSRCARRRAK